MKAVEGERRDLLRSIRALTAWLGEDVPIATHLREALRGRGVRTSDALLVHWTPLSESSFSGLLSRGVGTRIEFTYSWNERFRTGDIRSWRAIPVDDDAVEGAVAELLCYAAESRPARAARLGAAEATLGHRFPADYRAFMLERDGLLEWMPSGVFLDLVPIHDLVYANDIPQTTTHPGLVVIGSDGSREILGFDSRSHPTPVVLVDNASPGWHEAVPQARSFESFLRVVAETGFRYE